jgi:hypothetical protein
VVVAAAVAIAVRVIAVDEAVAVVIGAVGAVFGGLGQYGEWAEEEKKEENERCLRGFQGRKRVIATFLTSYKTINETFERRLRQKIREYGWIMSKKLYLNAKYGDSLTNAPIFAQNISRCT